MRNSRSQFAKSTGSASLRNSTRNIQSGQPSFDFDGRESSAPNDDLVVRAAISSSIRRSERSREQIADEMTAMLGTRVTAAMLNTYSAGSMSLSRLPAAWIRAFCIAVGDHALLHAIAEAGDFRLIDKDELDLLELGREYLRQKRASDQVALLEKRLAGVEL